MDREQLKYGTDHTSVKVRQEPGGKSSINLGWENPKKAKGRQDLRPQGYERDDYYRNQEPVYESKPESRSRANRDYQPNVEYEPDHYNDYGKKPTRNNPQSRGYEEEYEDRNAYNKPSQRTYEYDRNQDSTRKPDKKYDEYARSNYNEYDRPEKNYDEYERPEKTYDYSRGNEVRNNRGNPRNTEYVRDEYARNDVRDDYGRNEYTRDDDYSRNNDRKGLNSRGNKVDSSRGYQEYDRETTYNRRNDEDPYSSNPYQYEPDSNGRRQAKPKPKTSVKVQNPPGGQSSFIFG
jgi:hypothetical protein